MAISVASNSAAQHLLLSRSANQQETLPAQRASLSIPANALTSITPSAGPIAAPKGEMESVFARMFTRPVGPPDNAPENIYGYVQVGNKVVATLYNSGASEMSNEAAAKIGQLQEPHIGGPALAQWRAEQYAAALGGTVTKAPTAITQEQWEARPPREYVFDENAMREAFKEWQEAANNRHEQYLKIMDSTSQVSAQTNIKV